MFTKSGVGKLARTLGLVGECFRDELIREHEWRIPDLAGHLVVIPQTVHRWVRHGWVHSRRTPSGKHIIVWADKDEIRRLKRMAKVKNTWLRVSRPHLITPKPRPVR